MAERERQMRSVSQVNGFLNIYKPRGITSMDVVRRVKRLTGLRKRVGHAGTLDPLAEGVLPICLGQATRLMEYVVDSLKSYRMVVHLGVTTATYDAEGEVVCQKEVKEVDAGRVEQALRAFRGTISQTPPMYSALKREGQRLYKLAREGLDVERAPRKVEVTRLEMAEYNPPGVVLDIECGRGMYLRSLAHDIGQTLGCGAHLSALTRLRTGPFLVEESGALEQLEEACQQGSWQEMVMAPDFVLTHLKGMRVSRGVEKLLRDGQGVTLGPAHMYANYLESYRAYNTQGHLIGLVRFHRSQGIWRPYKVFRLDTPSPYAPPA